MKLIKYFLAFIIGMMLFTSVGCSSDKEQNKKTNLSKEGDNYPEGSTLVTERDPNYLELLDLQKVYQDKFYIDHEEALQTFNNELVNEVINTSSTSGKTKITCRWTDEDNYPGSTLYLTTGQNNAHYWVCVTPLGNGQFHVSRLLLAYQIPCPND